MIRTSVCWSALTGLAFAGLAFSQTSVGETEFARIAVDERVESDAGMEAYLAPYRAGVRAFSAEVVGDAAEPLLRTRPESGLTNLVADALLAIGEEEFDVEVDFAITNFGGLRRDLPAGEITMGLLAELSPFDNYMAHLRIDGELAWRIAESVAASGGIAVAGLRVERSSEGELLRAWIGGRPIDRDRSYSLVTIDYLVSTWSDLFQEEWISEIRISSRLVQRDAIVLHLSRLSERGVRIRNEGDRRVVERKGIRSKSTSRSRGL